MVFHGFFMLFPHVFPGNKWVVQNCGPSQPTMGARDLVIGNSFWIEDLQTPGRPIRSGPAGRGEGDRETETTR